jgi:hypothetical protein
MDLNSSLLEELDLDGFLFGSQDKQHSMDLDAGLSGVSLPELDEGRLALHLDASTTRFSGKFGRLLSAVPSTQSSLLPL